MEKTEFSLPQEELEAIDAYDYEKARLIYEAGCQQEKDDLEETKNQYQEELERSIAVQESECQQRIAQTKQHYEEMADKLTNEFTKDFNKIVERQNKEIEDAKKSWGNARDDAKRRVNKQIQNKLKSSQELAKSHKYEEAIQLRDTAFSMKDNDKLPEFVEVDKFYNDLLNAMLKRHKAELAERKGRYESDIALINKKCECSARCSELQRDVENSDLSPKLMKTAFSSKKDKTQTLSLVKMLSPRSKKDASSFRSPSRTSSRSSFSNSNIPRSPNRMGTRVSEIQSP